MIEINKFDVKVAVIPNKSETYLAFLITKKLVFIDSMQFTNTCLKKLVKNLSGGDFKEEYLSEELSTKQLELVKQKGVYELKTVLKDFLKLNCLMKASFMIL